MDWLLHWCKNRRSIRTKVEDIDFENNQIYINNTLEYDYDENVLYLHQQKPMYQLILFL